ncbi:Tetratricopeptide repeat protein [uncultured Desulfobacterium sp.]|uniref:Tetratricopeptide repeat protein n=1 Tax=uncultured Desulfobacterium sp. TaxID=201089 RepID=A0A445N1H8_9BACT|nr:Tetratricopeptide repeat protein [uncultured Desulfobacterium sp.]
MKINKKFYFKPIIFFVTLALVLSSFSYCPSKAMAISIEAEIEMGREFLGQIKRQCEFLDDDFANQYYSDLGQYLISFLETRHFPFHFYMINDRTLNAFAAPGGNIFFFCGLINIMDGVDEMAAIMTHEIGHVSARHLSDRMEAGKKIGIASLAGVLAGIFMGGAAAGALITGSMAAGIQAQLNYSREDERQADQLGFKYMKESGFNPYGMMTTLKKIEEESMTHPDQVPAYLKTHPSGPERMSNLDSMLSGYKSGKPDKEIEKFRELFPMFQAVVRAKSLEPHEAERVFSSELGKNPGSVAANFGMGIFNMERQDFAQAIKQLNTALAGSPDFLPILTHLGEAYQKNGDDSKAISLFERAMKLDDENKAVPYLLGISYENMEQYDKAILFFERVASRPPVKDDVYYHLGVSYGREDKLLPAHYNFAIYFMRINQLKKAMFHLDKAYELAASEPEMQEKIMMHKKAIKKGYWKEVEEDLDREERERR